MVYTLTSLVEQTSPASHLVYDAVRVSLTSPLLTAISIDDLGGMVRGSPTSANDPNRVVSLSVYLATPVAGADRKQILSDVVRGSNQLLMPSATPREAYAHLCVYTTSSLVEQTTPTAFEMSDSSAIVSNIAFQIRTSTLMTSAVL